MQTGQTITLGHSSDLIATTSELSALKAQAVAK